VTITIVTPFHNAARYLAESIDSVRRQNREDWELLLVDDASTDDSPLIAGEYRARDPRIRLITLPRRLGPAGARNAGVEASSDGWLTFHDADDLMPPDRLANQVRYLRQHPEVDIVLGHEKLIIEEDVDPSWFGRSDAHGPTGPFHVMSLMTTTRAFGRIGPLAESFQVAEDMEWLLRSRRQDMLVGYLEEVVVHRRIHASNLSHDMRAIHHNLLAAVHGLRRRSSG
jgi:glycosyltransferase involved in cell wall biosynthesis